MIDYDFFNEARIDFDDFPVRITARPVAYNRSEELAARVFEVDAEGAEVAPWAPGTGDRDRG